MKLFLQGANGEKLEVKCFDLEEELIKNKKPKIYLVNEKHGVAAESPEEALEWYKNSWLSENETYNLEDLQILHLNNLQQSLESIYEKPFLAIGE